MSTAKLKLKPFTIKPLFAIYVDGRFTGHLLERLCANAYCRGWNRDADILPRATMKRVSPAKLKRLAESL